VNYIVAVDSGGTFSDCVVLDEAGHLTRAKAPSTPHDYAEGILNSIAAAAERLGMTLPEMLGQTILFSHGTTVATNTLLTRRGSSTGFITTRGHEDALIIGRITQKVAGLSERELADVSSLDKAAPIIPRSLIEGVHERIDYKGSVVVPLDQADLERAVARLVAEGVEAIAVCFLWSFKNPVHEREVKRFIEACHPDLFVTISSDLAPVIKEYERGATTALNAYLSARVDRYLASLRARLEAAGLRGRPVVMQSSGGVATTESARRRAVSLLVSGPAGGAIGAQALGRLLGHRDIVTTDVGGTSFDAGLIVDGAPLYAEAPVFDKYQIVTPVVDVASIGAGGGSIAWIEPGTGLLRVGPQSAGAVPGPACYGRGGTEPTVTDANVVLGRVNPDYFLGGQLRLDATRSREAVEARVARPLGLSLEAAAMGIVDIVDAHMADLIRKMTIERGYDPRRFVLYAFGGAGPTHVGGYARGLRIRHAVIPPFASEFSAFGIAGSDLLVVQALSDPAYAPLDPARLTAIYTELESLAVRELKDNGVREADVYGRRYMRLRYRGQVHEVRTPVPNGSLGLAEAQRILDAFEALYEQKYGKGAAYKQAGIQALTYHVHAFGRLHRPSLVPEPVGAADPSAARQAVRPVYFREADGWHPTPIYAAERLRPGHALAGPAVVEAADTTVVVHPEQRAVVDEYLNLVLAL
jgi:N-methylhydantoinase A